MMLQLVVSALIMLAAPTRATTDCATVLQGCQAAGRCRPAALRRCLREGRIACVTTPTTTSTTTTTTTTTTRVFERRDSPCGILTLYAGDCGSGVLGPNTCGRLDCSAGEDHFAIRYPGAPPPAPGDVLGDCTGLASTYAPELESLCAMFYPSGDCPRTSRLVCPTCCPQGMEGYP